MSDEGEGEDFKIFNRSSSNDEVNHSNQVPKKSRKQRVSKKWIYVREFEHHDDVQQWLKEQKIWSWLRPSTERDCKVEIYRCNRVKKRGPECEAFIKLVYSASDYTVAMYKTDAEHNCVYYV
jgi:hypothetical protein